MMFKNMSLRMKLTLITTTIMICMSVILTIISVINAKQGFNSISIGSKIKNSTDDLGEDESSLDKGNLNNSINEDVIIENIEGIVTDEHENESEEINKMEFGTTDDAIIVFKYKAIIYMLIVIVIGSIFIYFILGKILKPLNNLSGEVETINENKLSKRVTEYNNKDEINELAKSFNNMLDRLDKAFESQKRFSANASHELKTPLTALKINLDILDIDENPSIDDYKRIAEVSKNQTERMINLVDNLFLLSKQKDYSLEDRVNLDNIIKNILSDLEVQIKDKNLGIQLDISKVAIRGNQIMLTHSISNLVENAVKYNKQNGTICISLKRNNKECIIKVKDTGIGIDDSKVSYIFEPFYRVDNSRSRKIGGAGLGLAITKDIIDNHGGNIKYYQNKPEGSVFEITLPINS